MKNIFFFCLLLVTALLTACSSTQKETPSGTPSTSGRKSMRSGTRLEFTFSQLLMKNSDQIKAMVKQKMEAANPDDSSADDEESTVSDTDATQYLKDALRITFGRPDQDGIRGPLFTSLRRELVILNALESSLKDLADEGITELQNPNGNADVQATYVMILENLMAEIKPDITKNKALYEVIERIRDADIEIPEQLRKNQLLSTMWRPQSPSKTAEMIVGKRGSKK